MFQTLAHMDHINDLIDLLCEPQEPYGLDRPRNNIVDKTFAFALRIVAFTKRLHDERHHDLARQLFKAGTAIGAHVSEAQQPESRADFIHKMKIAAKEARESEFWLKLCRESDLLPYEEGLLEDCAEINRILGAIIASAHRNA